MSLERELLQRCLDEFEYKGVACNELCIDINKLLAQPDINTQYLLDQVARLTAENAMLKEKWLAPPKREPLSEDKLDALLMGGFSTHLMDLVRMIEKAHGIGGGE